MHSAAISADRALIGSAFKYAFARLTLRACPWTDCHHDCSDSDDMARRAHAHLQGNRELVQSEPRCVSGAAVGLLPEPPATLMSAQGCPQVH
eukprot:TRINITY_DN11690_c0_g1_i1.p1 TRINITY_DN11690_c0_g1~~TRINITY_DN11690_c0_g1_i1.p1  ORF type:complete len:100 (+),score=11.22 TRINITY_DN11690_c0_g1_i1:26-301(+)